MRAEKVDSKRFINMTDYTTPEERVAWLYSKLVFRDKEDEELAEILKEAFLCGYNLRVKNEERKLKSEKLKKMYTKGDREPKFLDIKEIDENTELNDILYTYNEMSNLGFTLDERMIFLDNAKLFSKKQDFCFLYPDAIVV